MPVEIMPVEPHPLSGKKILLGITGGIAAYKVCTLIRSMVKVGASVKVVMTPSAREFVTETTLATLTKNPVFSEQFNAYDWKPEHISLADEADLLIIAPISANTIGKIACGIADNLLTSITMAFKKSIILVPAMNCNMWDNPAVQENLSLLQKRGYIIVPPESGELACGYEGNGRLADIAQILKKITETLRLESPEKFLTGKKIILTAGGTKEPIDPVRFITNRSSGRMGIAIADAAHLFGAETVLISTMAVHKPYRTIVAPSASEMLDAVKSEFSNSDALIMAAAVADFRAEEPSLHKIKKDEENSLTIKLVKNTDILQEISALKNINKRNQIITGFCAETENLIENAKRKIQDKNLDFIAANDISRTDIGFESEFNEIFLIDKAGIITKLEKNTKTEIAKTLLKKIFGNEQ